MAKETGIELASAYVTLVPSLKGASRTINAQLSGVSVSKAGAALGRSLGESMADGLGSSGVEKMQAQVARAERELRSARDRASDSAREAEVAEKRLAEALERHGAGSSQASRAELQLEKAQRKAAYAAEEARSAEAALERASKELALASDAATSAARRQGSALSSLSRDMALASSAASRAGDRLSSFGSSVSGAGAALTASVTAPLGAAAVAAGGYALSVASSAEQTQIGFETMLGGAEQAAEMMGDLSAFAAKTPFELSGLQDATKKLLAYGFAAEDVIPMLTSVGDATSALGSGQEGIESVTRALGQMKARGKVSAEEMLQLTEQGIPAWEYLARAIGTDTAGAMAAVSDGAVDATTGIKAMTDGMDEDFGGLMERQSKTLTGLMSNLSDAVERPLMKLKDTEGYDELTDAMGRLVDEAGPFVESLLPHMESGLDAASGLLDKATGAMEEFSSMSEEGQAGVIKTVAAAAGAGPALTLLGGGLRVAGAAMGGVSKIASGTSSAISLLSDKEKAAEGASGAMTRGLGVLRGGLATLGVGVAVAAVGELIGSFVSAAEHEQALEAATADFGEITASAIGKSSEAASAAVGKSSEAVSAARDVLSSMQGISSSASDALSDIEVKSASLDGYLGVIERLADKSNLTETEQYELADAVKHYNDITGDSVEVVDTANGKLSKSTDELNANAEAWENNAKAQAYQKVASEYYEEQIRASHELAKAQDELAAAEEGWGVWLGDFPLIADPASLKYHELQQSVDDLSESEKAAAENAEQFGNAAAVAASSLDGPLRDAVEGLPAEMQGFGLDVASSLAEGVKSGSVSAEAAADFVTGAINGAVSLLPADMQAKGAEAVGKMASAISSGDLSVQAATSVLLAAANGTVSYLPPELSSWGAMASEAFAGGIGSGEAATGDAASRIAAAATAMASNNGAAEGWGSELAGNFASGIERAKSLAEDAARGIASAVASYLHFTEPDEGPLVGINASGYEMAQNYARAMTRGVPLVARASDALAQAARFDAAASWGAGSPGSPRGGVSQTFNIHANDPELVAAVVAQRQYAAMRGAMA